MEGGQTSDIISATEHDRNLPESSRIGTFSSVTPEKITRWLLREIMKRQNTKVILVMGVLRPGKSSLVESITGANGLSGHGVESVTGEYHLTSANIEGDNYIFVDTPGFADPHAGRSDEEVYLNIMKFVELVRGAVTFVGVLFVHRVGGIISSDTMKTLEILKAFSGVEYFPFITFVTTFWDTIHPRSIENHENEAQHLIDHQWSEFTRHGAMVYHHGKVYNDIGVTSDVLYKDDQAEMRQQQAQRMIVRHYKDKTFSIPLVVKELNAGFAVDNTTVAKVIGVRSRTLQVAKIPPRPKPSSTVSSTSAESDETSAPNWLDMLASLLWGSGRRFCNYVMSLLPRLPSGTTWAPRYSSTRGIEIVLHLPLGHRLVVSLSGFGLPTTYHESGTGDRDEADNIAEDFEDDFYFGCEQDREIDFGTSERDSFDVEKLMEEFNGARGEYADDNESSGWGCAVM